MINPGKPENARAFNTWLVKDWLVENNYSLKNVMVFDYYNVLTDPDNHHRLVDGEIEYTTSHGDNRLYYDSYGDDHANPAGNQKATAEAKQPEKGIGLFSSPLFLAGLVGIGMSLRKWKR